MMMWMKQREFIIEGPSPRECNLKGDAGSSSVPEEMKLWSGSEEGGLSGSSDEGRPTRQAPPSGPGLPEGPSRAAKQWAVSKSVSEDSGVDVASTQASRPSSPGSEHGLPRFSRTVSLWQIPQVSAATPLPRRCSELEVGPLPHQPPLGPLERALQRTLPRKRGGGPEGPALPQPPSSWRPLAQSQPQLWSEGAAGTLPGPRYPLRRTPSANGSNHHAEERWGGPRSSVQGLRYLQQVCWLFDRIANLQECNAVLKQDRKDLEEQLRRHERQQELVRLCCSCGSAAFVLEAGPTRPRGRRGSPCQPHNPAAPCQRQPSGPAEPASIRLRKRWASDTSVSREAKGDMGLHHCKRDSFLLGNKDDLSDRSGGETCQPDSSRMTKDNRPQWDRVKSLVNRLKVKQGRGGSFVAKLKGTIQQNHS